MRHPLSRRVAPAATDVGSGDERIWRESDETRGASDFAAMPRLDSCRLRISAMRSARGGRGPSPLAVPRDPARARLFAPPRSRAACRCDEVPRTVAVTKAVDAVVMNALAPFCRRSVQMATPSIAWLRRIVAASSTSTSCPHRPYLGVELVTGLSLALSL